MVSYKALNTLREALISQTRDGIGNGDGGQTAATREAVSSQTRDGRGNGDGGQTCASLEATISQTRDGVFYIIYGYFLRNDHIPCVPRIIRVILFVIGHGSSVVVGIQIVVNAAHLDIIPPGSVHVPAEKKDKQ